MTVKHLHVRLTDAEKALVAEWAGLLGLPQVRVARRVMEGTLSTTPQANIRLSQELGSTFANLEQLLGLLDDVLDADVPAVQLLKGEVWRAVDRLTLLREAIVVGEVPAELLVADSPTMGAS